MIRIVVHLNTGVGIGTITQTRPFSFYVFWNTDYENRVTKLLRILPKNLSEIGIVFLVKFFFEVLVTSNTTLNGHFLTSDTIFFNFML